MNSDREPSENETQENEVEASLREAEEMLRELRSRYEEVEAAKLQKKELESRRVQLLTELESVKTDLYKTWETLESQLITWRDKQELIWQFLRFAGVGFAIAFLVNWLRGA